MQERLSSQLDSQLKALCRSQTALHEVQQELSASQSKVRGTVLCLNLDPVGLDLALANTDLASEQQASFFSQQTGLQVPSQGYGEYFRHFLGFPIGSSQFEICDVPRGQRPKKALHAYAGVVGTGGAPMLTDGHTWLSAAGEIFEKALDAQIPTMAVCLSHQVLANQLGVKVRYLQDAEGRREREFGLVSVDTVNKEGLLKGLNGSFIIPASHSQEIDGLSSGMTLTARNERSAIQGYRVGTAEALQNHPEIVPLGLGLVLKLRLPAILKELTERYDEGRAETRVTRIIDSLDNGRYLNTRYTVASNFLELLKARR